MEIDEAELPPGQEKGDLSMLYDWTEKRVNTVVEYCKTRNPDLYAAHTTVPTVLRPRLLSKTVSLYNLLEEFGPEVVKAASQDVNGFIDDVAELVANDVRVPRASANVRFEIFYSRKTLRTFLC